MFEKKLSTPEKTQSTAQEQPHEKVIEILANKRVYPTREGFIVSSPDERGNIVEHRITRNFRKNLVCSCKTFFREYQQDRNFQCEHLLAVDVFEFANQKQSENPAGSGLQIKWRCHFRTQRSIEDLMKKITEHPEGKPMDELRSSIQKISGNRAAPEGLLQVSAERIELWLKEWLSNLTGDDNEPEFDRAA